MHKNKQIQKWLIYPLLSHSDLDCVSLASAESAMTANNAPGGGGGGYAGPCLCLPSIRNKRESTSSRLLHGADSGVFCSNVFIASELGAVLKKDGSRSSDNSNGGACGRGCYALSGRLENQDRELYLGKTSREVIGRGRNERRVCRTLLHHH